MALQGQKPSKSLCHMIDHDTVFVFLGFLLLFLLLFCLFVVVVVVLLLLFCFCCCCFCCLWGVKSFVKRLTLLTKCNLENVTITVSRHCRYYSAT